MTQQKTSRAAKSASETSASNDDAQTTAAFFKNLIWSTQEPGAPPPNSTILHSPQISPFASIFGLGPVPSEAPSTLMIQAADADPTRTPSAEELDLHEYHVQQKVQQQDIGTETPGDTATQDSCTLSAAQNNNLEAADDCADEDDDTQWVEVETSEDDMLDTISELISKAWYGSPLPPPLGPYAPSKPRSLLRNSRHKQGSSDKGSILPSWLTGPWKGPALLRRSSHYHDKPFSVRFAEQVLGEEVVAAIELIQKDILENPAGDPLPDATIKFFVKAGLRVATGWARSNLNRVFAGFGLYVAATCGLMHYTKRAAKWLAWRLPGRSKAVAGPAVTFTSDILLPTAFFGPFFATYIVLKIIVQERNKALEAAKAADAADDAAAKAAENHAEAVAEKAGSDAPAGSGDLAQQADLLTSAGAQPNGTTNSDMQQQATLHYRRQLARRLSMQRSGSLTGRGTRLHNRQFYAGRAMKARPLTASEKAAQLAVAQGESLG